MVTVKTFDYFNHEIQEWTKRFEKYYAADIEAILQSKRIAKYKGYTIIEDDDFARLGWYENGRKIM